jgi:hypothetical protein
VLKETEEKKEAIVVTITKQKYWSI